MFKMPDIKYERSEDHYASKCKTQISNLPCETLRVSFLLLSSAESWPVLHTTKFLGESIVLKIVLHRIMHIA